MGGQEVWGALYRRVPPGDRRGSRVWLSARRAVDTAAMTTGCARGRRCWVEDRSGQARLVRILLSVGALARGHGRARLIVRAHVRGRCGTERHTQIGTGEDGQWASMGGAEGSSDAGS
jgi:hypothetical protein